MQAFFYACIAFFASIIGAICGMGGGIIIKPMMELFQVDTVETIRFLSSTTILGMTTYTVIKNLIFQEQKLYIRTCTPIAIGSIFGGMIGKHCFFALQQFVSASTIIGMIQSFLLVGVLFCILVYTIYKSKICALHINNIFLCGVLGLCLGTFSSFIGIGGGQVNFVVLTFFLGMDTKTATQNSLYIIFWSQLSNIGMTIATSTVPSFSPMILVSMVFCGIIGSVIGKYFLRKMDADHIERLFMIVIIGMICLNLHNGMIYMHT